MTQPFHVAAALWGMSRPMQLLAVFLVYSLGTLVAKVQTTLFDPIFYVDGLIVLLLVAASIHYANEYADHETDALTTPTPFSGGSGVLARGIVSRRLALQAAWVTLLSGIVAAAIYVALGYMHMTALLILAAGAFGGWMYSLPPLQLAWRGFGEADNAFLGGMLLPLYGYTVQTGYVDHVVICAFVPFMLLVFLNLLATTWPDRRADATVGKYTLATQMAAYRLRWLYGVVALFALLFLLSIAAQILPVEVVLGSFAVSPFVAWGMWTYTRSENPLASVSAMVALLLLQLGGWGWVCAGVVV